MLVLPRCGEGPPSLPQIIPVHYHFCIYCIFYTISRLIQLSSDGDGHYLKLHMPMTPPTGRLYNHRQLFLNHSWLWSIEYLCLSWPLRMTINDKECMARKILDPLLGRLVLHCKCSQLHWSIPPIKDIITQNSQSS